MQNLCKTQKKKKKRDPPVETKAFQSPGSPSDGLFFHIFISAHILALPLSSRRFPHPSFQDQILCPDLGNMMHLPAVSVIFNSTARRYLFQHHGLFGIA